MTEQPSPRPVKEMIVFAVEHGAPMDPAKGDDLIAFVHAYFPPSNTRNKYKAETILRQARKIRAEQDPSNVADVS